MAVGLDEYIPGMKEGVPSLPGLEIADLGDIIDANENELLEFDLVASAVNYVRLANAATTNNPTISAQGDDTNVSLTLTAKGTGGILIDQDGEGVALTVDGENTTTNIVDINGNTLTTGKALDISDLAAITTGKAIHIDATGITQTSGILVHIDSAGTVITGAGRLFLSDHTGATTTSGVLNEFASAANDESTILRVTGSAALDAGVALDISLAAMTTGKAIDISNLDAITTGKALHVDATGVTHTTGILVHLDSAATAITGAGRIFLSDHTGATTTSGILNEFKSAATDETNIVLINATGALSAGIALDISLAAMDTGKAIDISNLDAITTGKALHIDATGITQTSGILVHIDSAGTVITGAGRLFLSDHTGATTTTGLLNEFASAATDETEIVQITASGALAAGKALDISVASMTTGTALSIADLDALTTGIGIQIASAATAITGAGRLLYSNHTGITSTSGILNEFASAATDETVILRATASAALALGVVVDITATSMTTGTALDLGDLNALTTGNGIVLASTSATMTTAELINASYTASGTALSDRTGAVYSLEASRTEARLSLTTADDYDLVSVRRTSVTTGAGGTMTAAGSVLRLENVATQTAGTLTDTVNVLELVQDADSTGNVIRATNAGIGTGVYFDQNANGVALAIDTDATTAYTIRLNKTDSSNNYIQFYNLTTGTTTTDGSLIGLDADESLTFWQFENNFMKFATNNAEQMRLDALGNLGLGTSTFGTNADTVFSIANGVVPASGPINTIQLFSKDISAGNTTLGIYAEGTGIVATGQADSASSVRVTLNINGTDVVFLAI